LEVTKQPKYTNEVHSLILDTLLPLAIYVSATDVADGEGGFNLLWQAEQHSSRLELIQINQAYAKVFKRQQLIMAAK
jgi:hypothetical protein